MNKTLLFVLVLELTAFSLQSSLLKNKFLRYVVNSESIWGSTVLPGCNTSVFKEMFSDKYVIEEHQKATDDGYNLLIFRVNLSDSEKAKLSDEYKKNLGKIVLLQHGLFDSADSWFYAGENLSVGFYMINKGYDVWVGNNRGNKYSHSSTDPNVKPKDFFDYCFDDMAKYDIPAFYNYILDYTKQETLIYFGHSMGTSQFFAAAVDDTTTELVTLKTEKFFAFAPIVYMNHVGSTTLKWITDIKALIGLTAKVLGLYEVFPNSCINEPKWAELVQIACDTLNLLCDNVIPGIKIDPTYDIMFDDTKKLLTHYPAGSSIRNLIKYAQAIDMGDKEKFQKYDFGTFENLKKYGTVKAPYWDLTKLKVKTVLLGGDLDELGSVRDVAN